MPRSTTPSHRSSVPSLRKPSTPSVPTPPSQYTGPSFGQAIKEGVAYGVGSSIAHNMVGRLFGAPAYTPREPAAALETKPTDYVAMEPCLKERTTFENCVINESSAFCIQEQDIYSECIKTTRK